MKSPETQLYSQAFNVENLQNVHDMELRDDVISYLGEYRLQLQKYSYRLTFSDKGKGFHLRDTYRGEPMSTKAVRAIEGKRHFGEPTRREEAELLGIISLEDQLRFAQTGDTIFWASPPGAKEEGYGDYGFIYMGNVLKNGQGPHLSMTAIRIEQPTIAEFNQVLTTLTGVATDFQNPEDFLQSPRLVHQSISMPLLEDVLAKNSSFIINNSPNIFSKVMHKLSPMVEGFISLVKRGTIPDKLQAFHALENYALELKIRYEQQFGENVSYLDDWRAYQLYDIMRIYGYEPPRVAGSCGPSGKTRSNGFVSRYEALMKAIFGEQEWFNCPECNYQADGPVGNTCPGCGITKEDYVKESGKEICD